MENYGSTTSMMRILLKLFFFYINIKSYEAYASSHNSKTRRLSVSEPIIQERQDEKIKRKFIQAVVGLNKKTDLLYRQLVLRHRSEVTRRRN